MNNLEIVIVPENNLKQWQKHAIDRLNRKCFSHVAPEEAEECFCAESFARAFAHCNGEIVGHLKLFKRNIEYDGKKITLGGIGGVCVTENTRRKGIATKMIRESLKILRKKKCDVACLNADLSRNAHKFYEKVGFTLMNRKISFEDKHGNTRYDEGTMFIPICSKQIYQHIMNSDKTFHYGKGYW